MPAATNFWVCGSRNDCGLSGDAATSYAREVVAADFEEAGDRDVIHKVTADLAAKGVAVSEAELGAKMAELMAQAVMQVKAGTSGPSS